MRRWRDHRAGLSSNCVFDCKVIFLLLLNFESLIRSTYFVRESIAVANPIKHFTIAIYDSVVVLTTNLRLVV